jgi:type 1 glutamine amidotransferase
MPSKKRARNRTAWCAAVVLLLADCMPAVTISADATPDAFDAEHSADAADAAPVDTVVRPVTNPYPADCPTGGESPPTIGRVDTEDPDAGAGYPLVGQCPPASSTSACPARLEAPACFADPTSVTPQTRCPPRASPAPLRALVYSHERGWCPHPAHCAAEEALRECGAMRGWSVVTVTADERAINTANLAGYDVVVFLMTGQFALTDGDPAQNTALAPARDALQAFVHAGHGFAGLHSVTATDRGWDWFVSLTGASFAGHPPVILPGTLRLLDAADPLNMGLPDPWVHCEELHSFTTNPASNPALHLLLALDEACPPYPTGLSLTPVHPLAWHQNYDGGRAFITSLGHTAESWDQPTFLRHMAQGVEWAAGY